MGRIQSISVFILFVLGIIPAFSADRRLDVEVRNSKEPYAISISSSRAHHYAVRNEIASTISKFMIPTDDYVVVEVRFASGYVASQTVNMALNPKKKSTRVLVDRDQAVFATDLVHDSNTISVNSLGDESQWMGIVQDFERKMELGDLNKAEKILWELVEKHPESALGWNNLGALRLAQGNYKEAADFLKRALGSRTGLFEAHLNLSRVYFEWGHMDAALRHATKANELRKGHPAALSQQATIHLQQKEYTLAKPILEQLREVDPYNSIYPDLGLALESQSKGNASEAAHHIREWALKHPSHPEAPEFLAKAEKVLQAEEKVTWQASNTGKRSQE